MVNLSNSRWLSIFPSHFFMLLSLIWFKYKCHLLFIWMYYFWLSHKDEKSVKSEIQEYLPKFWIKHKLFQPFIQLLKLKLLVWVCWGCVHGHTPFAHCELWVDWPELLFVDIFNLDFGGVIWIDPSSTHTLCNFKQFNSLNLKILFMKQRLEKKWDFKVPLNKMKLNFFRYWT